MKRATWMLVTTLLGACGATESSRFGTFVQHDQGLLSALATEATEQITLELPAERYALRLFEDSKTGSFAALANALRSAGYRVHSAARPVDERHGQPVNLGYAVDYLGNTRDVRLSLEFGHVRLGRVYEVTSDGVAPLGPWSRTDASSEVGP